MSRMPGEAGSAPDARRRAEAFFVAALEMPNDSQ